MKRPFQRFIGVDLGGGRGKTTAVAELRMGPAGAEVIEVATRSSKQAWTDETLVQRLATSDPGLAIAAESGLRGCGQEDALSGVGRGAAYKIQMLSQGFTGRAK